MQATMITISKIGEGEEGYEDFVGQWLVLVVGAGDQFHRYVVKEVAIDPDFETAIKLAHAARRSRSEKVDIYVALSDLDLAMPVKED